MGANSFIFFGLLLIPLIIFLVWIIRQDKKRNYLGLLLLVLGIVIATYTIISLDKKYMHKANDANVAPKASSFR